MKKDLCSFETIVELMNRWHLVTRIPQMIQQGWEIMYCLPQAQPPQTFSIPSGPIPCGTNMMDPNTGQWITISVPSQPEPMIEVGYIRFRMIEDRPEDHPCPRCSFPFPDDDRIDRET